MLTRSFNHLSSVHLPIPIIHPGGRADTIIHAVQIGGPPLAADRRLYISRRFMAAALRAAEAATTSRAVLVGFGLHVRLVRDGRHDYEVATIVGQHIAPEDHALVRSVLDVSAPGVADIEAIHRDEPVPLGRGRVEREVIYQDEGAQLIFEAADVLRLIEYCGASVTGWMQIHGLGLQVRTWQRPDGSTYKVCAVLGVQPGAVSS